MEEMERFAAQVIGSRDADAPALRTEA